MYPARYSFPSQNTHEILSPRGLAFVCASLDILGLHSLRKAGFLLHLVLDNGDQIEKWLFCVNLNI